MMSKEIVVLCRKNKKHKAVYISIAPNNLDNLGEIVANKVREKLSPTQAKTEWLVIDMVDTHLISTSSNPINAKMTMELLIYVADMTGMKL